MTTTPLQPVPLGRRVWAQSWRVVVAALAGLMAFGVVWPELDTEGWSDARLGLGLLTDLGAGLVALFLYCFRHRAPLLVTLPVIAMSTVSTIAAGAGVLALVSLAVRRRPVEIAVGAVAMLVTGLVGDALVFPSGNVPMWQTILVSVIFLALVVAVGVAIGQRRALVQSLRERAALLERDQQLREDRAREQERAHLAREMHDVLGHRLSLVALHAGALEYRGRSLSPDATVEAAGVVRAEAHAALTELRDVLGVLREPGDGAALAGAAPPQPTLRDLPALLDEARGSGARVSSAVDERVSTAPDAVGRHAYRVVQEALTNARRHAPGQPVSVAVDVVGGPALRVRVSNPTTGIVPVDDDRAAGHGLRGLAERARLVGGTFSAGRDADGTHVVEAVLPWTA
ncbi:sensor histidine kinase [Curtobacterium sp. NPDC087080]|uniref:sensor histidine kinase n=1 Tax=Curtobacterium sp. NPDC087080 TaxID=3363965 RepID=UPI00382254A8